MKTNLAITSQRLILRAIMLFGVSCWSPDAGAENRNVWIDWPVNTQTNSAGWITCVGVLQDFTALEQGLATNGTWSWSNASMTSAATDTPSTAQNTWSTPQVGKSVVARYAGVDSHAVVVRVIEVGSLTNSEGTLVVGSSPPMYVVCRGAGDVVVGATPNPPIAETNVPVCWWFRGGQDVGLGAFQQTVTKTVANTTRFTATAGTSRKDLDIAVVEVSSAQMPDYDPVDDGDGNPDTVMYVICKSSGYALVTATPNPGLTEAQLTGTCWSTEGGIGTGKLTRAIDKSDPKITTVTFTAGNSTKTVKVVVVSTDLKSIEFTSDHGLLKNNNSDWTDYGTVYTSPEWVRSPATNNPISHTKNSSIIVKVKVKVEPAGVPFNLVGYSGATYLSFSRSGNTSTGADQDVTITASSALPNEIATLSDTIRWTIWPYGMACNEWTSGPHTIYVTYSTPSGSSITEKRVSWACNIAQGASTQSAAALNFRDSIALNPGYALPVQYHPDPWFFLSLGFSGDCITLANIAAAGLQMVGISAGYYCSYPTPDGTTGWPPLSGNSCRTVSKKSFSYMGQSFEAKLVYPGNDFEGFFSIADPSVKAYTVFYPAGPFENQTYYYLQVLRSVAADQFWVWDGTQTKGGITVYNWNEVPGAAHIPVPAVP